VLYSWWADAGRGEKNQTDERSESMKVSRTTIMVSALTLILALTAIPAISQDKPADTMQIVREKIRADKKVFVAVNLELTDSEAEAFWPIYDNYQKELDNLADRFIKLIEDYARNYGTMSDEAAMKLLDEYLAIEGEHQRLRQSRSLDSLNAFLADQSGNLNLEVTRHTRNKTAFVHHIDLKRSRHVTRYRLN